MPCVPYVINDQTDGPFDCYYDGAPVGVLSQSNRLFSPAYAAAPGYDRATGLGSVNVFNLVQSWPGNHLKQ